MNSRPDRFALWAVIMAVVAMLAGVASADAASGGISATSGTSTNDATKSGSKYDRIWKRYSTRNKRWARRVSRCESGHNPRAIGGGGMYRGAFQFTRSTWRTSPKSPGGDPIRYRWRVQAVVAVELRKRDGRYHWPNCG